MAAPKHRILIVDDDGNVCYLVKLLIEVVANRFEVKTETVPEKAVAVARSFKPHLIVLDLKMPGIDGLQLARNIEADPALAQTRIVFLTGTIHGNDPENRNGVIHVPKSAGVKVLIDEMDHALAGGIR